ncbi:MAG: hypothetical protein MJZ15_07465 [Bacteroidales bacterium]|nr:hypothetical protein [Bacteroidales bacterium]
MKTADVVRTIEAPFGGNLNGVSVLVCGASDLGKVAILLARHSAKVVLLTESAVHYESVKNEMPQALDMTAIHTDISGWIVANVHGRFDIVVSFDCYLSMALMLSDCAKVVSLHYADGDYCINVN